MTIQATCPQGHTWKVDQEPAAAPVCPICGEEGIIPTRDVSLALVSDMDTTRDQRTLPWLPNDSEAPATVLPSSVPGYEILGELGRGGMGVVYLARQVGLNRMVALKVVLFAGHVGSVALSRFRAEAETVAQLQHPNIVQVFEISDHEQVPFISLEYCAGGSLDQRLRLGKLSPEEAATLVQTMARAVQAAHDAGIVHRDLKPGNILFHRDGTLKITDFGLAKKLDTAERLTLPGSVLGTPGYMAPEQAAGQSDRIGPATDVFALGAILYECLVGQPPFLATNPVESVLLVLQQEPPGLRSLDASLPADLETICHKALAKDPARRYPSARALADDLDRFLRGESIQARPVSRLERSLLWCRRNRLLVGLGGLAFALALLVGILVAVLLHAPPPLPTDPSLERVLQSGVLRIATDPTYPPMEYRKGGQVIGFDITLGEELGRRLGVQVEWHYLPWNWANLVSRLNDHEFDLILSGITIDDERSEDVAFVQYLQIQQVFVCRRGIDVRRWKDLEGKVVAVQRDTPAERNVRVAQQQGQSIRLQFYPDTPATFRAVAEGQADVAFAFKSVAEYLRRADPLDRLVVTAPTDHSLEQHGMGMALRKGDHELHFRLETELAALKRDRATWTRWLTEYFGD
ncbi:MAG: transporter substrate-binding domain-containing protein [Gemmataceae bacterium]